MSSPPPSGCGPAATGREHCWPDDAGTSALVRSLEALLAGAHADPVANSTRPSSGEPHDSDEGIAIGHAGAVVDRLREAFPDAAWTIDTVSAERDLVLCHATVTGTHSGGYAGQAPTARRMTMRAVFVARRGSGESGSEPIADWWCALDDSPVRTLGSDTAAR